MRRKYEYLWILVAVLCLALAGCSMKNPFPDGGGSAQGDPIGKEQIGEGQAVSAASEDQFPKYDVTFRELDGDLSYNILYSCLWDGFLYYGSYDDAKGVWEIDRIRLESGKSETFLPAEKLYFELSPEGEIAKGQEEHDASDRRSVLGFDVTRDGGVVVLIGMYSSEDPDVLGAVKGYQLAKFDSFGELLWGVKVEDGAIPEVNFQMNMGADEEGNVILSSQETKKHYLISREGKRIAEIGMEENTYIVNDAKAEDGTLYLCMNAWQDSGGPKYELKKVDFRGGELVDAGDGSQTGIGTAFGQNELETYLDSILVYDEDVLYGYSPSKAVKIPLAKWSQADVLGNEVSRVHLYQDKIFVLASSMGKNEIAILSPKKEGTAEKKTVKLAVIKKYSNLSQMVSDYNKSQDQYHMEVVEYGKNTNGSAQWQEPANRLMMDVLGENVPDLIDIGAFTTFYIEPSYKELMEKSYIEDLGPYLDQSTKIGREDFEEKVLEMFTCPEGIPAIPTTFALGTLAVSSAELGDRFGWSVSDFMAYDRAHPDMDPVDQCDKSKIFSLCVLPNLQSFVDLESGESHFDCPIFRELMKYANSYPQGDGIIYFNAEEKLVSSLHLMSPYQVQNVHNSFDGTGIIIGYPSLDGKPLSKIYADADAITLSICSEGREKAGAWDFMEYVLSHEPITFESKLRTYGGFASNKNYLKKELDDLSRKDGPLSEVSNIYINGKPVTAHPFTEEERETLQRLLDSVAPSDPRMNVVQNIVMEEREAYFAGQKSLDEVIRIIDNRVGLYLKENE